MTANVIPLFPDGCPNCRNLADNYERELARIGEDLHNAELSLRGLRSAKTKLENQLDGRADEHRRLPEAKEVYEYWRAEIAPRAKEFGGKRRKAVLARLDGGRTVDELKLAVDGAKIDATTGSNGVRHDDLEFICREDQHVLRFINAATVATARKPRAPASQELHLVPWRDVRAANRKFIVGWLTEKFGTGSSDDDGSGDRRWPCPRCVKRGWDVWLHVAPVDAPGRLVRCYGCELDEVVMLRRLAEHQTREGRAC